ncbi:ras guanine nucleotide exchange factor domain-containing protein [Mycena rosella]|uniref:Ras guanine nucleotide exchange factor domain-containing protein n=1 Tax=Mycena rosella TaxID=1033263 RepID=A0AAD7GAJ6_MYCRO|nr:ras guanine nucleotide exchange factor domain-containing protein [Mycena rosella]
MVKSIARHGRPVEVAFPSLKAPTQLLRQMKHVEQLDQMLTVAPVFCNCIGSIRQSIYDDMFLFADCVIYSHLDRAIDRASLQLHLHIEGLVKEDNMRTAESMLEALRLVEVIMKKLPILLRIAETFYRMETKPLPALPAHATKNPGAEGSYIIEVTDDPSPSTEDRVIRWLESQVSLPSDTTESATLVGSKLEDGPPASQTTPRGNKHNLIRRVLQMSPEPSKAKIRPTENTTPGETTAESPKVSPISRFLSKRTPLAVVNPDNSSLTSSTTTLVPPEAIVESPYVVRQSYIYDCTDPLRPQKKVTMPLPAGDTVAIRLDSSGDVKAASLPALHVPQVFAAICARWDEMPPHTGKSLTTAQQRVWIRHVHHVRGCLARLLLAWLTEYWRAAQDAWVLPQLRNFVTTRFAYAQLDEEFIDRFIAATERAEQDEHISRLQRAMKVERQGAPPVVPRFEIALCPDDDYTLNIWVFETAAGRERFAGQVTDLAHGLFRTIDPEEAVARWVNGKPIFFDLQKFEEELLFWVAQSILSLKNREERVAMIEFWLDVATICVRLRNFSSASSIFGGLVFSPVERLSLTILDVAIPSKDQYRKLDAIFGGTNNYAVYRRALAENDMPAVPLMSVLHKDVISANEISGPVGLTSDPDAAKTLIHFSAFRMLKKTICTMEACLVQYNIDPVPVIQDWIRNQLAVLPHAEHRALSQQMDELSRQLEARAPPPIQKGLTWLQTVTGSVESGVFTLKTLPDPGAAPPAPKLRKNKSIATLLNLRTRSK